MKPTINDINSSDDMDLGTSIKKLRVEQGMSQKDLASQVGISANAICSIEKNKSFPSKQTIDAICYALQIPVGYLLFSSITDDDVPPHKLEVFKALQEPLLKLFGI